MRRELSTHTRLPFFALLVVLTAAALALLLALDPTSHSQDRSRSLRTRPPAVIAGSGSADDDRRPRAPRNAVRVGRRFLDLYVRLQTTPPDALALRELRSLSSLSLAHTLLAQPPAPAGGRAARKLARVRIESATSGDVRIHAEILRGPSLLRVRCLVQRDQGRWTVTALSAAP